MTTSIEKTNATNFFSLHSNMQKFLTKIGRDSSPISAEPGQTWNQNLFSLLLVRTTMLTFCPTSPIQPRKHPMLLKGVFIEFKDKVLIPILTPAETPTTTMGITVVALTAFADAVDVVDVVAVVA